MATLECIIDNNHLLKEGNLIRRRYFVNIKKTTRDSWYNRRRHSF